MDMDHIMTWATDVAKGRLLSTDSGGRSHRMSGSSLFYVFRYFFLDQI